MKFTILSTTLTFALASANPHFRRGNTSEWEPAGADDLRGPCPMMNTLANHGFLPHDGRNITKEIAVYALNTALNFNTSLASIMWEQAVIANPESNATFFTLDHLNRHNVLEHDASMSRTDAFFGNNHVFNQTIFKTTTSHWTGDVLDANMLANGKLFRQVESRSFNPNYTFTATTEQFSIGEMAAPIIVFGDIEAGTVDRDLVLYFFENERLPTELGWTKKVDTIDLEDAAKASELIANATNLITSANAVAHTSRRRDLHAGFTA
ncbi:Chloroperoxidase [Pseudomassariella vexata]|uniref:Chloroperoxidase n=1 Tax=Pseudomassariella vexata TaxID=1141098 RepID=A0A1Y2DCC6_9PEZI|nr:Chloroperoxidase [Pseudomassariella vexata]ORY56325.1 Chloroperoxidase [Pseudomassariella vexata]